MAARTKKSSRSRSKAKNTRAGTKSPARNSARGSTSGARSSTARSASGGPMLAKRSASKSSTSSRGTSASKRASGTSHGTTASKKKTRSKAHTGSPIARVTRVAKELAQQATSAVAEGVEVIKEAGGSIVDRVTA